MTYKEDFLSKFPKAITADGRPSYCRDVLYGNECSGKSCTDCWNEQMPVEKLEVKEVRRQAKVGEWIKIINAKDTFGKYENGNILNVIDLIFSTGDVRVKYFGMGNTGVFGYNYITVDEYVVLENYKPEEKTEPKKEPKYKVGDKVKLTAPLLTNKNITVVTIKKIHYITMTGSYFYSFEEDSWLSCSDFYIVGLAKPYNGKVVCLDTCKCSIYTVGKCYQFKEGKFFDKNDSNFLCPLVYSFDQWTKFSSAKWLEIVED